MLPNYMKMMMMRHRYNHVLAGGADSSCHELSRPVQVDVESPKHVATRSTASPLSSMASNFSTVSTPPHALHTLQSNCGGGEPGVYQWWRHKAEDCLWLASAVFILYYGDFGSDFFSILANDVRVLRAPLHMGLACLMLDVGVVMLYVVAVMSNPMQQSILEGGQQGIMMSSNCNLGQLQLAPSVLQVAMVAIGSTAFILMCVALWPIWSFLTVPMLFTLLMALTVVAPYILVACTKLKQLG